MRILLLENFSEVTLPQDEKETEEVEANPGDWNVIGVYSWNQNQTRPSNSQSQLDVKKLRLVLRDGRDLASLDMQTLQVSRQDVACSVAESCLALVPSPDGKIIFGLQWSEEFVVFCIPQQEVKYIRSGYGMTLGKRPSLYRRILGKVQGMFGSTSSSQIEDELQTNIEPVETLFPLLQSTSDGLAFLCFFKPGEGFLFICSYSSALRYQHISNVVGEKVQGRWFRIFMDDEIVSSWVQGKGLPSLASQIAFSKGQTKLVKGAIVYSAFVDRKLEVLYGMLDNADDRYELKWGLIKYELNWIVSNKASAGEKHSVIEEKPHFLTTISSQADKIAIAINSHCGVYIHIQSLPGSAADVKLERVIVPLCSHCDYGNAIYYDEECWISSLEWLADDCYLAVSTRCGCLSFFHRTGEPIITKLQNNARPEHDIPCDFFIQVVNARTKSCSSEVNANVKTMKKVGLKWSGPESNVLIVSHGSKLHIMRIIRVSNYIELSDIKIPATDNFTRPSDMDDIQTLNAKKINQTNSDNQFTVIDNDSKNDLTEDTAYLQNHDAGERINCTINAFVKELPQAEIILRPVVVHPSNDSLSQQKKTPVQFIFSNNTNETREIDSSTLEEEGKADADEAQAHSAIADLEDLQMDFELAKRNRKAGNYLADDEMTEKSAEASLSEHSVPRSSPPSSVKDNLESPRIYTTTTGTESSRLDSSENEPLSDSGYSPPFTELEEEEDEEEDENELDQKIVKKARKQPEGHSSNLRLVLPEMPKINGVIPYAPRSPECENVGISDSEREQNSVLIITQPPPPTKSRSRSYCIMSPISRINLPEEPFSTEQLDDKKMGEELAPGANLSPNDECNDDDDDINDVFNENNEELVFSELEDILKISDDNSDIGNGNEHDSESKPDTAPSTILPDETLTKNNVTQKTPCLKKKKKAGLQKSMDLKNDSKVSDIEAHASLSQFFGRSPVPPCETKNDMLDYLRGKLQSLKKQTQDLGHDESVLPHQKYLQDWVDSLKLGKECDIPTPVTDSNKPKSPKVNQIKKQPKTVSQPNFLQTPSIPAIKKSNVSEPQLNKSLAKSPTPIVKDKPKPSQKIFPKVKTPPALQVKNPHLYQEFTVGSATPKSPVRAKAKPIVASTVGKKISSEKSLQSVKKSVQSVKKAVPNSSGSSAQQQTINKTPLIKKSFTGLSNKSMDRLVKVGRDLSKTELELMKRKVLSTPASQILRKPTPPRSTSPCPVYTAKKVKSKDNSRDLLSTLHAYLESAGFSRPTSPSGRSRPYSPHPDLRPISPMIKSRSKPAKKPSSPFDSSRCHTPTILNVSLGSDAENSMRELERINKLINPKGFSVITKTGKTVALESSPRSTSSNSKESLIMDSLGDASKKRSTANTSREDSLRPSATSSLSTLVNDELFENVLQYNTKIRRNKQVRRVATPTNNTDVTTDDGEDEKASPKRIGTGLTIFTEVMEHVPIQSEDSRIEKILQEAKGQEKDNVKGKSVTSNSSENKIQRRVSFSDPIAVFKTMSPEDLTKEEEVEGEIYDDETEDTPSFRLRRMYTQLFDL